MPTKQTSGRISAKGGLFLGNVWPVLFFKVLFILSAALMTGDGSTCGSSKETVCGGKASTWPAKVHITPHALVTSAGLRSSPLPLPDVPMCRTTVSVSVWGLRSRLEVVPGTLQIGFACFRQCWQPADHHIALQQFL